MRADTAGFTVKNLAATKRPRYAIEVAFDSANSVLWTFTSHSDVPAPGSVIQNVVENISGTSQTLTPDRANASIGNINFTLVDKAGIINSTLGSQIALGRSTRRQRVRVYVGYEGLPWSDYSLVQTQLVTDIGYSAGAYSFRCMDVQRELRADIFDAAKTTLAAQVAIGDATISVADTSAFSMVAHGTSYSDAPSSTVGYIKIDKEVIRYTGKTSTTFTGCTRGALNTRPIDHSVDLAAAVDRRTAVEEYVYLEMPAVKLIYALLTGTLYGQGGAVLPTKWNLGVPSAYVQQSDFLSKPDLWDSADDTKGFIVRLEALTKTDGKKFLEEQLGLLTGTFLPVYASGALGLRRMANILAGASYIRLLNETNVKSAGELKHDFDSLHNNLQVNWNYEPQFEDYTRLNILLDAGSIAVHGKSDPLKLSFRGLHGSIHSSVILAQRFDALRDRYSGPPLRLSLEVTPSNNQLEIGDIVRVRLASVRDFVANGTLDRSFEVQGIKMDWVTGAMSLELFASSQAAGALAPSTDASVLTNAWYTSAGTDLATVLTITGSNPGHISANGTITGGSDLSTAVFYYNGDLQLDVGINVNITGNVQLRVKGFFQNNGTINGKGGGLAGATAPAVVNQTSANAGTAGGVGSTEAGGGLYVVFPSSGRTINSTRGLVVSAANPTVPSFSLSWDGTTLRGIPTDLRGSSGSSGMPVYEDPSTGLTESAVGGNGGASGAGLCVVCRGFAQGVSAKIDLSGNDGIKGTTFLSSTGDTYSSGSGAGGSPGGLLVLVDGAGLSAVGLTEAGFVAISGKTPLAQVALTDNPHVVRPLDDKRYASMYVGTGDGTTFALPNLSGARGGSRIQYIPNTATGVTADPGIALSPPSELQGLLTGGTLTAVWNPTTDPMVAGYDLQYKLHSGAWPTSPSVSVTPGTANSATLATGLGAGPYDIRIRSAGSLRQVGDWVDQQRLVQTRDITDLAVTTIKIIDSGVTTVKINDSAVTTAKITDANVTTAKIADANVTTSKLATGAVTTTVLADGSVTTVKLGDASVTTVKTADGAITTAKIGALQVTTGTMADGSVTTGKLVDLNVTTAKLADLGVTTGKLNDYAATATKVGDEITKRSGAWFNLTFADRTLNAAGWASSGSATESLVTAIGTATVGGNVLHGVGYMWRVFPFNIPFNPTKLYRLRTRYRATVNSSQGAGHRLVYIGFQTFRADNTAANSNGGYAYVNTQGFDLTVAAGWQEVTTWVKGASVAFGGNPSTSTSPTSPAALNVDTVWVRPMIALNYPDGDGTFEVDYYQIDEFDEDAATRTYLGLVVDGTVAANKVVTTSLAANVVTAAKIAADTITANEIAASAIGTSELAAGAVTAAKITAGTITTNEIAANTIVAGNIAASTITGAKIAAATITSGLISVSQLDAISANLGAITAGSITLDTSGFIKGGATGYMTGTGFWMGYSGAYKFHIGNPSGSNMHWDGTTLTIDAVLSSANIVLTGEDGSNQVLIITDTADGSDNHTLLISPAGSVGGTRGAWLSLGGNESNATSEKGVARLAAGSGAGGSTITDGAVRLETSGGNGVIITSNTNVLVGADSDTGTSRTSSLLYIPSSAGVPTGAPTAYASRTPQVYDSTNDQLYVYNSSWKKVAGCLFASAASTSGTTVDFTGIPAWANSIDISFDRVSTNGTTTLQIRGGAGSYETTNYDGSAVATGNASTGVAGVAWPVTVNLTAANTYTGNIRLRRISGTDTWVYDGQINSQSAAATPADFYQSGGKKAFGGTLDRLRFMANNGTDTFDNGTISLQINP